MNSQNYLEFRGLLDCELEQGYQVLCDAVGWLREKKMDMWTRGISKKVYAHWQARGYNYGLFRGKRLCFVISAMPLVHPSWKHLMGDQPHIWLRLAAVAKHCRDSQVGKEGFIHLIKYFADKGKKKLYGEYVTCSQFLNGYYKELGFEIVAKQKIRHLHGMNNMTLIKMQLDSI